VNVPRKALLTLATTSVGLTAGVFFDWQVTVMPGLGRLPDAEFVDAFRSLDRAIMNPLFIGGAFVGGAASLVAATAALAGSVAGSGSWPQPRRCMCSAWLA
jgi:uncharacterized membrane protein